MNLQKLKITLLLSVFLIATLACELPGISAPTPFVFPTPNLTLTAFFSQDTAVVPPPTVTPTGIGGPTASPTVEATEGAPPLILTPTFTLTSTPSQPTATSTSTPPPTVSYAGPGMRPGPSVAAEFLGSPPNIDGYLDDWTLKKYNVEYVVWGKGNWDDAQDLSARLMVGWDNKALYIGVKVKDERYAQIAHGMYIYKGDSIEVLLDTDVSGDYYLAKLDSDDYQIGVSPGSPAPGKNPEAYLWFPRSVEGPRSQVEIGTIKTDNGYHIEVKIPWSVFGVTPAKGMHFGFAFSVSDNDKAGAEAQQSMVSNVSTRVLTDPTSWGDLTLTKP
ncbi:MAG: sugar-binding protein [Chloroflexota bacterium]